MYKIFFDGFLSLHENDKYNTLLDNNKYYNVDAEFFNSREGDFSLKSFNKLLKFQGFELSKKQKSDNPLKNWGCNSYPSDNEKFVSLMRNSLKGIHESSNNNDGDAKVVEFDNWKKDSIDESKLLNENDIFDYEMNKWVIYNYDLAIIFNINNFRFWKEFIEYGGNLAIILPCFDGQVEEDEFLNKYPDISRLKKDTFARFLNFLKIEDLTIISQLYSEKFWKNGFTKIPLPNIKGNLFLIAYDVLNDYGIEGCNLFEEFEDTHTHEIIDNFLDAFLKPKKNEIFIKPLLTDSIFFHNQINYIECEIRYIGSKTNLEINIKCNNDIKILNDTRHIFKDVETNFITIIPIWFFAYKTGDLKNVIYINSNIDFDVWDKNNSFNLNVRTKPFLDFDPVSKNQLITGLTLDPLSSSLKNTILETEILITKNPNEAIMKCRSIIEEIVNNLTEDAMPNLNEKIQVLQKKGIISQKNFNFINFIRKSGNYSAHKKSGDTDYTLDEAKLIFNLLLSTIKELIDKEIIK